MCCGLAVVIIAHARTRRVSVSTFDRSNDRSIGRHHRFGLGEPLPVVPISAPRRPFFVPLARIEEVSQGNSRKVRERRYQEEEEAEEEEESTAPRVSAASSPSATGRASTPSRAIMPRRAAAARRSSMA